jgi:hypothetical protein
VEEMAQGCKNTVNQEEADSGSADQQEHKDLSHSRWMPGMVEYSKALRQPLDQVLVMIPVEDERDKIQQSDQMILFPNRKNKRGQVFRNGDKPSLPEEADSHKNGSSSRVLLHLKSNQSWKLLFCNGNICAKAGI